MSNAVSRALQVSALALVAWTHSQPVLALELKDCQDVSPVSEQKNCISSNTSTLAEGIRAAVYAKCKAKASSEGNEGSALVLAALICTQFRLAEILNAEGG